MKIRIVAASATLCALLALPAFAQRASLRGSSASLARQAAQRETHDLTRLRDAEQVERFRDGDLLVPLSGGDHYEVDGASFPYVRPAIRLFVNRISGQYEQACGKDLVVTSAIRPLDSQPSNASPRSVHPAGIAVDFRISKKRKCRQWLESTLLSLERKRVLEATREKKPPHYHVAVFPEPYTEYVASLTKPTPRVARAKAPKAAPKQRRPAVATGITKPRPR